MKEGPHIAQVAALIGDPARANILTALMSGKALTASELAFEAGVTLQTASGHLTKLTDGGLIAVRRSGRHKYFNLASGEVAHVLEALMGLAAGAGHLRRHTGPKEDALHRARVCYNHLAGDMGVQLFQSLEARGMLEEKGDNLDLTLKGAAFMTDFGIALGPLCKGRARLCRPCLDWSARQTHLAGSLGRALLTRMQELGWLHRQKDSRAVIFSAEGARAFEQRFGRPAGTALTSFGQ